jgi:hypothetical protein
MPKILAKCATITNTCLYDDTDHSLMDYLDALSSSSRSSKSQIALLKSAMSMSSGFECDTGLRLDVYNQSVDVDFDYISSDISTSSTSTNRVSSPFQTNPVLISKKIQKNYRQTKRKKIRNLISSKNILHCLVNLIGNIKKKLNIKQYTLKKTQKFIRKQIGHIDVKSKLVNSVSIVTKKSLEIPNHIDDPCMFIDNVYDQLISLNSESIPFNQYSCNFFDSSLTLSISSKTDSCDLADKSISSSTSNYGSNSSNIHKRSNQVGTSHGLVCEDEHRHCNDYYERMVRCDLWTRTHGSCQHEFEIFSNKKNKQAAPSIPSNNPTQTNWIVSTITNIASFMLSSMAKPLKFLFKTKGLVFFPLLFCLTKSEFKLKTYFPPTLLFYR